jgi:hypothetical protein
VENPVPTLPDANGAGDSTSGAADPILRYTDLSDMRVAKAVRLDRTPWARTVIGSAAGPLLLAGEIDGRRVAVVAFDLHDSDLPLRTDFPLLMRNLAGWLLPDPTGATVSVAPGAPVALAADLTAGVNRLTVSGPDGSTLADYAISAESPRVTFTGAYTQGLYIATQWAGTTEIQREGFAVNLFSADESRIGPVATPPLPVPRRPAPGPAAAEPPRLEWWPLAAGLALAFLVAEWLVTHRLGLRRLLAQVRRTPEDRLARP